jgi:cytochrome c-type biogenesis protein CcmH/NrfG
MSTDRLDMLSAILEQDPNNLLARYGLAMEYAQRGDSARALENFHALMASNPDYVATYYQAGRVLQTIGQMQQAREVLQSGIAACDRVGNAHARSEMEAALAELPF